MITSTEQNYDITLTINLESIEESNAKDVFTKVSLLKRHTLSAPFLMAFNTNSLKLPIVINYRPQEGIYIVPSDDRVAVIFSTYFKDDTDKVFT